MNEAKKKMRQIESRKKAKDIIKRIEELINNLYNKIVTYKEIAEIDPNLQEDERLALIYRQRLVDMEETMSALEDARSMIENELTMSEISGSDFNEGIYKKVSDYLTGKGYFTKKEIKTAILNDKKKLSLFEKDKEIVASCSVGTRPSKPSKDIGHREKDTESNEDELWGFPANSRTSSHNALEEQIANNYNGAKKDYGEKKKYTVQYSVLTPKAIRKGENFLLDFYMYEPEFASVINKALMEGEGKLQEKRSGTSIVEGGSQITVRLYSPNIPDLFDEDEFVWTKDYHCSQLVGEIPTNYPKSTIILAVDVLVYGLRVTTLKCVVNLEEKEQSKEFARIDIKKAFFSYSSEDRNAVLMLKQGMEGLCPDIECFVDFIFLKGGQQWYKEVRSKIDQSDVLFLVWSQNAYKSKWVKEEWTYALETKGKDFIHPLAIEPIDKTKCPVPKKLKEMHFGNINAMLRTN